MRFLAEHRSQPFGILDTGQHDADAVGPVGLQPGLRDAIVAQALIDHLHGLLDQLAPALSESLLRQSEPHQPIPAVGGIDRRGARRFA